jgi:hypothetical protein
MISCPNNDVESSSSLRDFFNRPLGNNNNNNNRVFFFNMRIFVKDDIFWLALKLEMS